MTPTYIQCSREHASYMYSMNMFQFILHAMILLHIKVSYRRGGGAQVVSKVIVHHLKLNSMSVRL